MTKDAFLGAEWECVYDTDLTRRADTSMRVKSHRPFNDYDDHDDDRVASFYIEPARSDDTPLCERPAWHEQALCRGQMVAGVCDWFPADGDNAAAKRARTVCAVCPVQAECATAGQGEVGIWGG